MGDNFQNIGAGAVIVNRSLVEGAFNRVSGDSDESTAQALVKIADAINRSGNRDAAENFDSFNTELQKPEPKKSILRSLWQGVIAALPVIAQMTDEVEKITKLFST